MSEKCTPHVIILLMLVTCQKSIEFDAKTPIPSADAGALLVTSDAGSSRGDFDAGPVAPSGPIFGELSVWQLDLTPGLVPKSGEAAIVVGPDGTLVLIDVGNSNHADEVLAAVTELNTQWLIPSRGYRARAANEVEFMLLTHFHADHIGAFSSLTSTLLVTKGVIHRGFVDVGPALNENDFQAMCTQLRGPWLSKNRPLCTASPESPCVISSQRAPATGCPGFTLGALETTSDDDLKMPTFIDLGMNARIDILGANGSLRTPSNNIVSMNFGVTDVNEENARSIIGLVSHGAFRFLFAGDLSGSGATTEPDVESLVATHYAAHWNALGVDVIHANHHARKTSSNTRYVDATAPNDGRSRNVLAGINSAYVNSPHQETIDAWTANQRLGNGKLVVTQRAPLGGQSAALRDAKGRLVLQTVQQGNGYWITDTAFPSLRR